MELNWTKNSCESMNNILKLSANWKALKLSELVDKLHQIVKLQLLRQGNYSLAPWTKKFQISTVVWESKTEDEKDELFNKKLLKFQLQRSKTVTSSDDKLTIPRLHQRRENQVSVKESEMLITTTISS